MKLGFKSVDSEQRRLSSIMWVGRVSSLEVFPEKGLRGPEEEHSASRRPSHLPRVSCLPRALPISDSPAPQTRELFS